MKQTRGGLGKENYLARREWSKFRTVGEDRGDRDGPKGGWGTLLLLLAMALIIGPFIGIMYLAPLLRGWHMLGGYRGVLLSLFGLMGITWCIYWVIKGWRESGS